MSKHKPELGDWIFMQFGFIPRRYYILKVSPGQIKVGFHGSMPCFSEWVELSDWRVIEAEYLGRGRRRLRSFIPIIGQFFCPFTEAR